MIHSRIASTGSYLPERIMTNAELEKLVDTSDEWIVARTGIRERHIAADNETSLDLGEKAALAAMERGGYSAEDIDLIVVATCTPEKVFPSTACLLQERLGIHGSPAFDVQAACAGFIYAFGTAYSFIRSGMATRALVVGTETMSRVIDWQDRGTCVIFADGAGAVILEASDEPGVLSTHLHAEGSYKDLLQVPGWVRADYNEGIDPAPHMLMKGSEVFKVAVRELGGSVEEALTANNKQRSDVDWLIPHQANIRIIDAVAKRLQLPDERVIKTIERHGNTSAASVPLALDEACRDGRIQRGQLILLEAFGGGFAWGSALAIY
ncbi:MAG: 3-oxoacyl-ACP synthase [Gammaproteobacteria bacterium]|nr:MAG: 3-oxoacyl-ACP synthase [Gammaproteobacteria bacterium]RLA15590.1 MAG: 3-oxoacyl-ACP synthase [Gammaproteobacteria bacterium]RLA15659.1 MAG: 3-oxoacyl-ACP synthase [Gammaproteobacteria bacterium]